MVTPHGHGVCCEDNTMRAPVSYRVRSVEDSDLPRRMGAAAAIALVLNLLLWSSIASAIRNIPRYHVKPVEITRVTIDKRGKKVEKVVTKKQIEHKVAK